MKIGLITLPLHTNYGGIIQCYALQSILEQLGHSVTVLESSNKLSFKQRIKRVVKLFVGSFLPKKKRVSNSNIELERFISTYINRVKLRSFSDSAQLGIEGFIVGSDQVWRADFVRDGGAGLYDYYLGFTKGWNVKRLAFSASFGLDEWTYTATETQKCSELLTLFDGVSLREKAGVDLCAQKLNYYDTIQLVDPTLLLSRCNYLTLLEKNNYNIERDCLFSYILDPSPDSIVLEQLAKDKTGLPLHAFFDENLIDNNMSLPPVEKWLSYFRDSKMIITDSFHGCVFSIIFNKVFWVIKNDKGGNSRISSLLSLFGLESRFISPTDLERINIFEPIDWQNIERVIDFQRKKALDFIENRLK